MSSKSSITIFIYWWFDQILKMWLKDVTFQLMVSYFERKGKKWSGVNIGKVLSADLISFDDDYFYK